MNVGKRIRQRRVEIGMTVDELANKIGKNRATIYRYENGDIENLPLPVLEPIAKALGIEPSDLLSTSETISTEEKIIANLRKFNLSEEKKIIENIQSKLVMLNKDGLNKTDDYISDLVDNPKYCNEKIEKLNADYEITNATNEEENIFSSDLQPKTLEENSSFTYKITEPSPSFVAEDAALYTSEKKSKIACEVPICHPKRILRNSKKTKDNTKPKNK